jgi:hypothetical protein
MGTVGALDPYMVKQIQLYYNASTDWSLDPSSDVHSNIPPLLRMIDQHHFFISHGGSQDMAQVGEHEAMERNILKKKYKLDQEAKHQHAMAAAININKPQIQGEG